MMYCHKCGGQMPDNAAFCPKCGAARKVPEASPRPLEEPRFPSAAPGINSAAEQRKKLLAYAAMLVVILAMFVNSLPWIEFDQTIPNLLSGKMPSKGYLSNADFVQGAMDSFSRDRKPASLADALPQIIISNEERKPWILIVYTIICVGGCIDLLALLAAGISTHPQFSLLSGILMFVPNIVVYNTIHSERFYTFGIGFWLHIILALVEIGLSFRPAWVQPKRKRKKGNPAGNARQ